MFLNWMDKAMKRRLSREKMKFIQKNGAGNRNRTRDTLITNQVLYLLSYTGSKRRKERREKLIKCYVIYS